MKVAANTKFLKNGMVFDKVGVNKSTVSGKFSKKFRAKILWQRDGNIGLLVFL